MAACVPESKLLLRGIGQDGATEEIQSLLRRNIFECLPIEVISFVLHFGSVPRRQAKINRSNRLRFASPAWAGDPGDRNCVISLEPLDRAYCHLASHRFTDCAMGSEGLLRDAEQF